MITKKPKNHEKGWLHKHLPLASVTGRETGKAAMDRASIMKRWRHQPPDETKPIPAMKTFKVEQEDKDAIDALGEQASETEQHQGDDSGGSQT